MLAALNTDSCAVQRICEPKFYVPKGLYVLRTLDALATLSAGRTV